MTRQSAEMVWRVSSWFILLLAIVYFTFRGPILPNGQRLWDYAVCAASSYLWVQGEDPFAWEAVKESWKARGPAPGIEDDIGWLYAIVPPTTLAVLAPFAALPVAIGAYLYLLVTSVLTGISVWVCGKWAQLRGTNAWCLYVAAVLISVPATLGLYSGNPTMLAVPLLLIGNYLIATSRSGAMQVAGGVLIGVAVACKVQIALPFLVCWIVLARWRAALATILTLAVISAIAAGRLALAGVDWIAGWVHNVRETNAPGGLNDYVAAKNPDDLVNLQVALYRVLGDRTLTDGFTAGLWLALAAGAFVVFIRHHWRRKAPELPLLCAAGLLALLPIYHRTYDALVLLPLLAAVMAALARAPRLGWGWASLVLLASLAIPAGLPYHLIRRGYLPDPGDLGLWSSLLFGHKGWALLLLTGVWILALLVPMSQKNRDAITGVA